MSKKESKSKQKRVEQEKLAQQKQEQKKKTITFGIVAAVAIVLIVAAVILITALTRPSNYVCLTVSYTDDAGVFHTGDIIVELDPDQAPITVKNFQKLVKQGFYDGLTFHRVIEGFMIQGGAYTDDYQYREAATIKGEFSSNGIPNTINHTRGVISMARSDNMDSANSQFFIMQETKPHLDGNYAAFGMVIEGIEVVDKIAAVSTNYYDLPYENVVINSIRFIER